MKVFNIKNINLIKSQNGATLVVIIITMVALAVIGIAIYSLTYTASLNQVVAQRAAKAFYIAESCVRVAASEYKASANKNATLVSLHNQTFPMPGNQGSCTVLIYPYWLYAAGAYDSGAPSITLYLPGEVPRAEEGGSTAIILPAGGNIKIKGASGEVAVFSNAVIGTFSAVAGGTPVTFALSTPFSTAIVAGDEFYTGYNYTGTTTPSAGGNLTLTIANDDLGRIFPSSKGSIFVEAAGSISQYS